MGRKKFNTEDKKKTLRIHIPIELYETLEDLKVKNKSKLFSWFLEEHFNFLDK